MLREISLLLHIIGVLLWIGGSASAAWSAGQLAFGPAEARKPGLLAVRRSLLMIATPGILLAWAGGLTMFITYFDELYRTAGWMHGKVTTGLVVSALHGILVARVRKVASGEREVSPAFFPAMAMAIVLLGGAAVALVVLRPGT